MQSYYVDTCIYLNLWKKEEGGLFSEPFWKSAKKLFEKIEKDNTPVYYSGFILKELSYKLNETEFNKKIMIFESSSNFIRISLNNNEYETARKIERRLNFSFGFFDIIHLILAKKTNSILITRDKELIALAKEFEVVARKP